MKFLTEQTNEADCEIKGDAGMEAYISDLVAKAAQIRMPELFASKPSNALYHLLNRGGVSIVALRTADLSREQLIKILTYRLAQYVAVNFVEHQMVYKARMEHDPLSDVSSDDVRICLAPFLQCWLLLLRPLLLPRFPRQPEERNRRSSSRSVVVCHKPVK